MIHRCKGRRWQRFHVYESMKKLEIQLNTIFKGIFHAKEYITILDD